MTEEPSQPQPPTGGAEAPSGGRRRSRRRGRRGRGRRKAAAPVPAVDPAPSTQDLAAIFVDPAPAPSPVADPGTTSAPAPAAGAPPVKGGGRRRRRRRGRGGKGGEPRPEAEIRTPAAAPAPPPAPAAEEAEPARPAPARGAVPAPLKEPAGRGDRDFISAERLRACQDAIGYHFRDVEFLRNALTHSSVKTENHPSNERMEFLGDSVLGHVIAEYIYHLLPDYDEGEMTKVKSVVVSTQGLANVAERLRLDKHLIVGRGISMRGTIPQSLMANTFEAVVSAVYLDRGFESARLFILDQLGPAIDDCLHDRHQKNYKSILQQIAQRDLNSTPTYRVLREEGPDHHKDFEVVAVVGGYEFEPAWGPTKREAEQRAARAAVMALTQRLDLRGAPKAEGG